MIMYLLRHWTEYCNKDEVLLEMWFLDEEL